MKKLAFAFALLLSACGAAPEPTAAPDSCASCGVAEVCREAEGTGVCIAADTQIAVESVTVHAGTMVNKGDLCQKILSRCFRRCAPGNLDCQTSCVDDLIDCLG